MQQLVHVAPNLLDEFALFRNFFVEVRHVRNSNSEVVEIQLSVDEDLSRQARHPHVVVAVLPLVSSALVIRSPSSICFRGAISVPVLVLRQARFAHFSRFFIHEPGLQPINISRTHLGSGISSEIYRNFPVGCRTLKWSQIGCCRVRERAFCNVSE